MPFASIYLSRHDLILYDFSFNVFILNMGLLPLDQFLCWKLKVATLAVCVWVIVSTVYLCYLVNFSEFSAF